jgi:hypothetical protein
MFVRKSTAALNMAVLRSRSPASYHPSLVRIQGATFTFALPVWPSGGTDVKVMTNDCERGGARVDGGSDDGQERDGTQHAHWNRLRMIDSKALTLMVDGPFGPHDTNILRPYSAVIVCIECKLTMGSAPLTCGRVRCVHTAAALVSPEGKEPAEFSVGGV